MAKGWYRKDWRWVENFAVENERTYEQRRRVEAANRLFFGGRFSAEESAAERRLLYALLRKADEDADEVMSSFSLS